MKALHLLILAAMTSGAYAASGAPASEALPFYKTGVWRTTMDWVNVCVLLGLLVRYVAFPILKLLDKNIADIETRLGREEQEKRAMADRLAKAQEALNGVDTEGQALVEQARQDAVDIQTQYAAQTEAKLESIRQRLEADKVSVEAEASENLKRSLFQTLESSVLTELGGADSKTQGQLNEHMIGTMGASHAG